MNFSFTGRPRARAERIDQRLELRFIAPPQADRRVVDGSAHLGRACRQGGALIAVELETGVLPGQTAGFEQSLRHCRLIGDEVFVVEFDHAIAAHLAPMLHEGGIGEMVAAQILKIVGKRISHAEQGFVHRVAHIDGAAPDMDDACVRQGRCDQPDIEKIHRCFIHHPVSRGGWKPRAVIPPNRRDVELCGPPDQFLAVRCGSGEVHDGGREIAGLTAALYLAVRTQYAIDQRRSAARQSQDENRPRIGMARALPASVGAAGAGAELPRDLLHRCDIVFDAVAQQAAAGVRGAFQCIKGLRMAAQILEFLRHRIAKGDRGSRCQSGPGERLLQFADVIEFDGLPAQRGAVVVGVVVVGSELDDARERSVRFIEPPKRNQAGGPVVQRLRIARPEHRGPGIAPLSLAVQIQM